MRSRITFVLEFVWQVVRWMVYAAALAYVGIVIYAYPHDHQEHIDPGIVAQINAQKLTQPDVDGINLPPMPDAKTADAAIAGVDANNNGIRDDVELAIFAEYPTSSATSSALRSAELQYAMELQTQQTKVADSITWVAAASQRDRGFGCIYNAAPDYEAHQKEVDTLVFNTPARVAHFNAIQNYATSYTLLHDPDCDIVRN